jgi:RNA polymerase sigma-70 factor (ECF subfamily)
MDMKHREEEGSDRDWAEQAQSGSKRAFEPLVVRYETRVFRFLLMKTGNVQEAEDMTQTVFISAYRNLHRYRARYPFATWIFTIARRASISFYRKLEVRTRHEPALVEEPIEAVDPRERIENRELRENIWSQIRDRLTQDQYTAFWMTFQEGMNLVETARVMNKTVAGVKLLLYRGRRKLYKKPPPGLRELRGEKTRPPGGEDAPPDTRQVRERNTAPSARSAMESNLNPIVSEI